MPLRQYTPEKKGRCPYCMHGFEIYEAAKAPVLSQCPRCGMPVQLKVTSEVNSPVQTRPRSDRELKELGFRVFRKNSGGEYSDH